MQVDVIIDFEWVLSAIIFKWKVRLVKIIKFGSYYVVTILYSILIRVIGKSFLYIVNSVVHFLWIGHKGSGVFMYEHKLFKFLFIFGVSMILTYLYSDFK